MNVNARFTPLGSTDGAASLPISPNPKLDQAFVELDDGGVFLLAARGHTAYMQILGLILIGIAAIPLIAAAESFGVRDSRARRA